MTFAGAVIPAVPAALLSRDQEPESRVLKHAQTVRLLPLAVRANWVMRDKSRKPAGFRLKNTQTRNDGGAVVISFADSVGSEQIPTVALSGPWFSGPPAWPEVTDSRFFLHSPEVFHQSVEHKGFVREGIESKINRKAGRKINVHHRDTEGTEESKA